MSTFDSQVSKREIIETQIENTSVYLFLIGNHWIKTFLQEVMTGNHRKKTPET